MGEAFQWTVKEVSFGFAYIGIMIIFTQGYLVRKLLPLWGERRVLKWGLSLFAAGLFLIAFAPNLIWMTLAVTLMSIGNGLSNPSLMGSISLVAAQDEQGASLGVTQSLSALGRIVGPALGGFLFQRLHVTSPFIASGLIASLALFLVLSSYALIPEKAKQAQTH
jgi:MFS family permease